MNTQNKPSLVMAIALMTLVNGIFNLIWGVSLIGGTFGLSLLCFPVPLFPIILGGFEIAYAIKLLDNPPQPVQPSQTIAILEIVAVLVGNVFSNPSNPRRPSPFWKSWRCWWATSSRWWSASWR